jgi:hypothetical protein
MTKHYLTDAVVPIIKAKFEGLDEDGEVMTMTNTETIALLLQNETSLLKISPPEKKTLELLREEMTVRRCNGWRKSAKKHLTGNTQALNQARTNFEEGKGLVGLVPNYRETSTEMDKLLKGAHDGISKEEATDLMITIYCQMLAKLGGDWDTVLSVVESIRDNSIEELIAKVRKMVEDKNLDSIDYDNELSLRAATTHHSKALFDGYVVALTKGDAAIIYLNDGILDVMMKVSKEYGVCSSIIILQHSDDGANI